MKITKIGHCCLLIEVSGKRILTDPGSFTVESHVLGAVDIILITHEHRDHLHTVSITMLVKENPNVQILTNSSVGKLLKDAGVPHAILEGNDMVEISGIRIEAFDGKHVEIFGEYGQVQNTGYFIAETLFYPGDAYTEPEKPVDILALPVAGPWCKVADAVRYAVRIAPKEAIPVHDGLLNKSGVTITHRVVADALHEHNITFCAIKAGETTKV